MERKFKGRVLAALPNSHGYLTVSVGSPAKSSTVHRLVALAYIGLRPSGLKVNYKDGNKLNNKPENIEYTTSTVNNHHALRAGLRRLKIFDEEIQSMRALLGTISLREIGRRFNVHHTTVRQLVDGKRKLTYA